MMTSSLPWSDEVEALFENDLTSEFNIDDYHIDAKVIADSINPDTGKRITTLAIKIPRIILSEHNTHRCLVGETVVEFDEPATIDDNGRRKKGLTRVSRYTLDELYQKWNEGSDLGLIGSVREYDCSKIHPTTMYTVTELFELTGLTRSSIRQACREGELFYTPVPMNDNRASFLIKGQDYINWRINKSQKTRRCPMKDRIRRMYIRCYNPSTGEVSNTHITNVWQTGEKPTKILKTVDGHSIQGSYDHLIYTNHGWKQLQDVVVGRDKVYVLKNTLKDEERTTYDRNKIYNEDGTSLSVWTKNIKPMVYHEQNGLCAHCGHDLGFYWDLHHIVNVRDDQTLAFERSNVIGLCKKCHKKQHQQIGENAHKYCKTHNFLQCVPVDVESVTEGGVRMLYDIEVQDKNHNFLANRIVVHNCISRNFSSSRAIPAKKLRKEAWEHPFVPIYWGANKSGMSADQQLTGFNLSMAKFSWKLAGKFAVMFHKMMEIVGVHKQTCNRIIEPWMSVVGTITSTEWDNFLRLRYDRNAQPEIIVLAKKIHDAIKASEPTVPENGIHLPFIDEEERRTFPIDQLIKISVARCCRTSYANCLGKKSQPEEDIKLYHRLLGNGHFSPFEHIALIPNHGRVAKELQYDLQRNFRGWYQLRAFIQPESNTKYLNKMYNIEL